MFHRADFFGEEVLEVGPFVAFGFAFGNAGGNARVFGELFPVLLEVGVVAFYSLCVLVLDLGSEQVIVVRPKHGIKISVSPKYRYDRDNGPSIVLQGTDELLEISPTPVVEPSLSILFFQRLFFFGERFGCKGGTYVLVYLWTIDHVNFTCINKFLSCSPLCFKFLRRVFRCLRFPHGGSNAVQALKRVQRTQQPTTSD